MGMYFFCKDGNTLVMKADGSQTVVAENNLTAESPIYGVALVDRNIIVRSGKNLICVRETKNKK